MQVSFTDVFHRSKLRLSYLSDKKEVANCCFRFKGFKPKNTLRLMYLKFNKNNI